MERSKLVRDKVPAEFPATAEAYRRALDDDEYRTALLEKLEEETVEYVASKEAEELADMLEVLYALAELDGVFPEELELIRHKKKEEKGGFEGRIIWDGESTE